MQPGGLSHVVRPQRRGQDFQKKARAGVEQSQHMRHGKAAADALAARLTEFLLELRRIGHAEGRAVDVKGAMAAPAAGVVESRTQGGADALQQGLQHRQRQTAWRFTISGLAEGFVAKVLEPGHGEVAVENLYHEELNGGNRVEGGVGETDSRPRGRRR